MIELIQTPTVLITAIVEANGDISGFIIQNNGDTTFGIEVFMKGNRVVLVDAPVGTNTYTIPVAQRGRFNRQADAVEIRMR